MLGSTQLILVMQSKSISSQSLPPRTTFVIVLALCSMLGPMGMDLYLPSFHAIANEFQVSSLQVQQSISIYMLAMAVTTLFYGTLSDTFGRRRVLLFAIAGYLLSSMAISQAPDFGWLVLFRLLQGMMAGSGVVITRAMVQDVYEGAEARRVMSLLMLCFGLGPCIAPILGGYLQTYLGWRWCFYFLSAFALLLLLLCWRVLPETLSPAARTPLQLGVIGRNYLRALRNPKFDAMAVGLGLMAGANSLYITSAAEFIINILHLDGTSFGWLFIPHISGLMAGALMASTLANKLSPGQQSRIAYMGMILATMLNVGYHLSTQAPQIPWAVLPITIYSFSIGLLLPIKSIEIINFFPNMKGLTSSLQTFAQMFLFATLSGVLVPLLFHSGLALAIGHASCSVLGMGIWYWSRRLHR